MADTKQRSTAAARRWPILVTVARVAFDAGVVMAAAVIAFLVRFQLGWPGTRESGALNFTSHVVASLVWGAALLGAMGLNRLYDEDTLFPGGGELSRVLRSVVEAVGVLSVLVYFAQSFSVSRSWFVLVALLSLILLFLERLALRSALRREWAQGRFQRPVLLVSRETGPQLEATVAAIPEFRVVSQVTVGSSPIGLRDSMHEGVDVVVAAGDFDDAEVWRMVIEAGEAGHAVFLHSPVRAVRRDRLSIREVGGRTLVKVAPPYLHGIRAFQKRAFDIVGAGVLGIVTLPLVGVIALAILVTSGPPVFYGGERIGKEGTLFTMWKFRSMHRGAEVRSAVATLANDPRRTRLGRLLRRASLDELPQLWNVLRGHMSLVGPRPFPTIETTHPQFVERFSEQLDWAGYRNRIRPGITGWAQVQGFRGDSELDPRIDSDNWYIENWSVALDLKILLKTLVEVVRGRNAY
jgi:exopolysaccharide biosynthesis polyprenyl glycosylphosphotransferase